MTSLVFVGMAMVLAAQATARDTPQLWVDTPADLRCPDEAAVLLALRARLGEARVARGRAATHGFSLRLLARGSRGVKMVLRQSATVVVERVLDVREDECAALAETLALMVELWLAPRGTVAPRPPERPPIGPEAGVSARAQPALVKTALPTSTRPGESAPPDAVPESVTAVRADDGNDGAAAQVPSPPSTAPASSAGVPATASRPLPPDLAVSAPTVSPAPAPTWTPTLAADAGAMVSLDARATVTARARADFSVERRRWRMGLRGAIESSADLDDSAGQVMVRHIPAGAYLGRRLVEGNHATVTSAVGAGVDVISAHTSGYAGPRSFRAIDPLVLAGLQGEWRLGRRIGVFSAADLMVALRREQFSVANLGPVTSTSRLRAGLALGVAWHQQ